MYPDFTSLVLMPSLHPPLLPTVALLEPSARLDRASSVACSGDEGSEQLRTTQPQAPGKQSHLHRAIVGRDPAGNGEKSRIFSVTHLMENLPYQQDVQKRKLRLLVFFRGYAHSILQHTAARRVHPTPWHAVLSSVLYGTTADSQALC